MASKAREKYVYTEKDTTYIRRLIYDVLVYTLPKCGFPETKLPTTECEENVYNRANFLEIARASTLRVSLIMRDKWTQMFTSRLKSSGFSKETLPIFLEMVVVCCPLSWSDTTQSIVNASFAVCNEIIMFFHHENVDIDPNIVINSIGLYITNMTRPDPKVPETVEDFFDKFDNISEYTRWITDFIDAFAIPYGSIEDISELFFDYVKKQWRDDFKTTGFPETMTVTKLRDYVGFLPHDFFENIAFEENAVFAENLEWPPGMILSDDHESLGPQKLVESSETGAVGGKNLCGKKFSKSTMAFEQTIRGHSSKIASELGIEDDLGQMSLGAEGASQTSQAALPERKNPKKKKSKKKHK
ncbi:hypothetical protein HNY73_019151 [Argiope bruennichi]|uniref:Uncharacterized protein n=1 Tax=Argiope bruennichi TaxID=94029 RepID=A0A8T0EFI6_ARGBR|nr:hypothetical protein HNY73_019151 [Argiope bruennichi]